MANLARRYYDQVNAETLVADREYAPVRDAYRAGQIDDATYLAARKRWTDAHERWDQARAAAYPGT